MQKFLLRTLRNLSFRSLSEATEILPTILSLVAEPTYQLLTEKI